MSTIEDIKGYIAVKTLDVGTNKLEGGGFIAEMGGQIPIVFGNGEVPMIWINTLYNGSWVNLVSMNKSSQPNIKVEVTPNSREELIKALNEILAHAKMINDDYCKALRINLKSIGINLLSDENSLEAAGTKMQQNTFTGVKFMFGFFNSPKT
ncbi:MAG: hypothetical protein ABI315_11265 [Bacteroidia bacterium]